MKNLLQMYGKFFKEVSFLFVFLPFCINKKYTI